MIYELEKSLVLFDTGIAHHSGELHKIQKAQISNAAGEATLARMADYCVEMNRALARGNLRSFGEGLHKGWMLKKDISSAVSSCEINLLYEKARTAGALGGKLLGAGAGGHMVFYVPVGTRAQVIAALAPFGLQAQQNSTLIRMARIPGEQRFHEVGIQRCGFVPAKGRTFIIAEIGNNHNGSLARAKQLVDIARNAGADCVKFQIRDFGSLYRATPSAASSEDLGVEYIKDLLKKVELTVEEHHELRAYVRQRGLLYVCTPWDEASVEVLRGFDVDGVKIASADLFNPFLIEKAASLGKPLILSTGMSYEHEILRAVQQAKGLGVPFALLHCNSAYPAPDTDIQLEYIPQLKKLHGTIGYSGHERGIAISIAAVALGAVIIERHLTLDRLMEGPDHPASLEPEEFRRLVEGIRQVDAALRTHSASRQPTQGEMLNRENLSKSVVAKASIAQGAPIMREALAVASPGQGLAPYQLSELIGRKATRDIPQGDFLVEADLHGAVASYEFARISYSLGCSRSLS